MPEQANKILLHDLLVRPDDTIERDQVLVSLRAEGSWTDIMTLGNISTIIGKAKSRKTFFITLLVSGVLTNRHVYIKSGIDNRSVVVFDTEQGKYHVWKVTKRIEQLVGNWPNKLEVYGLRPLTVAQRLHEIENYVYQNELSLVVIDGIRDLVTDINSAEQATEIVGKLMTWSYERNFHICTVLHQNKADDNARGHIGTEIVNKSETVIQVAKSKDKNFSVVSSVYTRGQEIKDFQFRIENGLPVVDMDEYNNFLEVDKDTDTPF